MSISVQPVDGLINRLLQQNSKPSPVSERHTASHAMPTHDQVTISAKAQSHHAAASDAHIQQQNRPGEKALESHLLNLYKSNDNPGG